jgi:predicted amidohydrolase
MQQAIAFHLEGLRMNPISRYIRRGGEGHMAENRRQFLRTLAAGAASARLLAGGEASIPAGTQSGGGGRQIPVALIQCDSVPGQVEKNLASMERLAELAAKSGAQWILFHELTVCDYLDKPGDLAELVPQGGSTERMAKVAERLRATIAFGLVEKDRSRIYDTFVFVGPRGYVYHYRKTWLWYDRTDVSFRDEWARFDPGTGPELFQLDGVRATCFICADSNSKRCVERAAALKPQVVLFPINRAKVSSFEDYGNIAKRIGAPMLVANRVGRSIVKDTLGGCVVYSAKGEILARANMEGREEILRYDLELA